MNETIDREICEAAIRRAQSKSPVDRSVAWRLTERLLDKDSCHGFAVIFHDRVSGVLRADEKGQDGHLRALAADVLRSYKRRFRVMAGESPK